MRRKQISRIPALALAVILSLASQPFSAVYGAVYGADDRISVTETELSFDVSLGKKSLETEMFGTIAVSLISVTLPSDGVEFQVNPDAGFDARTNPGGQIIGPDASNFKVINNSVVPVRLEIAEVGAVGAGDVTFSETFPGGPVQSFRLVERVSEVKEPGTAILVLGRADRRYTGDADFEQYAIYPGKKGIPITDLQAGEDAGLQIYGKAAADFYGAYQFTVKPTLKISAVRAN